MFYYYSQNNSGGYFTKPAINVFVEAENESEADSIAEANGLYFDGRGDCPCCGDRWYPASDWDASEEPEIYGKTLEEYENDPNRARRESDDVPLYLVIRKGE